MKRPLLAAVLFIIAGILGAHFFALPPWLLLGSALAVAMLTAVWSRARAWLLCVLLVLTGWTDLTLHTVALSPDDLRRVVLTQPDIVTVRGVLHQTPWLRVYEQGEKESWRTLAQLDVSALCPNRGTWRRATGRLAVTTPGELTNLWGGQTVEVTGVLNLPKIAVAEGTFDYRHYLEQLGIYYQLQSASEQDWQLLSSPARPPISDRFRAWGRRALALGLPEEDESLRLEWALTLGWKTALTEEVSEPFVQAATYHIFAVDGLRMAIIFGIFFGLLRAVRMPRPVCGLVLLPMIWFYVALTGWPASAIRATVMLTIVILGWALNRPSDLFNSLFAAAFVILIWEPQQLFQAGFQLSFFVVLCIIVLAPPMYEWFSAWWAPDPLLPRGLLPWWRQKLDRPMRWLFGLVVTSFAAWVGSLPLVANYFNIVSPVSTPANVLAVPLCALVLMSNLGSLLLAGWFPGAAVLLNHAAWFLMECIRVSSHWFAGWPRAYFYVPAPSLFTDSLYYAVLLGVVTGWLFKPALRRWKMAALGLFLALWSVQAGREQALARLSVLPVNGGIAAYLDAPGFRDDVLIDCGTTNSFGFTMKPFLRAQGVNRLPKLLLTHGDLHHIGGAELVARAFAAKQVCVSPVRFRSPAYRRAIDAFSQKPGLLQRISRDDRVGRWTVLHPSASEHFPRADDNALVLAGTFHGTRILLLSDLGRAGQNVLLERTPDLRADIVVTGLPSASEALCEPLLDAIRPKVIVVADSEFPASERASARLQERLAKSKIPVLYTRTTGAATIEVRQSGWEVRTMGGERVSGSNARAKGSR